MKSMRTASAAVFMFGCFACAFDSGERPMLNPPTTMASSDTQIQTLSVSSPAFAPMALIPEKYTCDGANVNPPLQISGIPEETQSLALIVDDPDAPRGTWYHWIVWNIPVSPSIAENSTPGTAGRNDFGNNNYGGPCPPSGTHRYFFKVYALDSRLDLPVTADKRALELAMDGHILSHGTLIGRYRRK